MIRVLTACFIVIGLCSCATTSSLNGAKVSYSETAKQNFDLGEKALKAGNISEALAYFDYVRNKYPYSKYAGESDLRVGDAYFAEEKWLEAADAYDFFIRFHPVHEQLPYAYFRVAKANFNAMPSDFFLYPRSYTKDQTATKDALAALDKYLQMFPNDANVKEAKEMRVQLRDQAALLDVYVAKFYMTLRKWRGAAQRFDDVVKNFADTPSAKTAMLELAYIKKDRLDQVDEAKELLQRLTTEFADSSEAKTAKSVLSSLEAGSSKAGQ